ncbi:DUF6975 family protein [Sphingomonas radiodurans]|uniref:DUF6975 family protein n=1 Tax=Sphingomonas radiodurans TaxID=2890321 RepID=UPI001E39377B|nr:hypothetical protein [Sphingomonas radiodurans]WBH17161.1 hypothetical protein LLW23_03305 [Sphingomonas radiodurans]
MSTAPSTGFAASGRSIGGIVAEEGTLVSDHARSLCLPGAATRDLSDAVHALCALHGATPSMVELAIVARGGQDVQQWMHDAAVAFDDERHALALLTAAIGPLPSTPGQAESEAAISGQQRALATLARSDRSGCALGAALALLLDWHAIRPVLDAAAHRAGSAPRPVMLPAPHQITAIATRLAAEPAAARAMMFGAQQLIAQHRGLWHLLDARAGARNAH